MHTEFSKLLVWPCKEKKCLWFQHKFVGERCVYAAVVAVHGEISVFIFLCTKIPSHFHGAGKVSKTTNPKMCIFLEIPQQLSVPTHISLLLCSSNPNTLSAASLVDVGCRRATTALEKMKWNTESKILRLHWVQNCNYKIIFSFFPPFHSRSCLHAYTPSIFRRSETDEQKRCRDDAADKPKKKKSWMMMKFLVFSIYFCEFHSVP